MYARYQAAQAKADEAAEQLAAASLSQPTVSLRAPDPASVLPLPSLADLPPSAGGPDAVRRRCAAAAIH